MTRREQEPKKIPEGKGASLPSQLPPELAEFLKDRKYACLTHATDKGTVFVVKAPVRDIESVRGRVPIHLRQELYAHVSAPVIRIVLTIYDQPDRPLAIETFINVEDPQQAADFEGLAKQEEAYLLFYDEKLKHRLTKGIKLGEPETLAQILNQAKRLLAGIPEERFNFEEAKAAVMARTKL
jgi:hypothetical protein